MDMKQYFFFKEYLISGDSQLTIIKGVATVEVDFARIEQELPTGAQIKIETVQTHIEGGRFVVYGEYSLPVSLEELVTKEAIDLDQVLGDEENLPSLN